MTGKKSEHFAVGTYVMANNRRGEILEVQTCKCRDAHKRLKIRWEDGSVTYDKPIALNNHVSRKSD